MRSFCLWKNSSLSKRPFYETKKNCRPNGKNDIANGQNARCFGWSLFYIFRPLERTHGTMQSAPIPKHDTLRREKNTFVTCKRLKWIFDSSSIILVDGESRSYLNNVRYPSHATLLSNFHWLGRELRSWKKGAKSFSTNTTTAKCIFFIFWPFFFLPPNFFNPCK